MRVQPEPQVRQLDIMTPKEHIRAALRPADPRPATMILQVNILERLEATAARPAFTMAMADIPAAEQARRDNHHHRLQFYCDSDQKIIFLGILTHACKIINHDTSSLRLIFLS